MKLNFFRNTSFSKFILCLLCFTMFCFVFYTKRWTKAETPQKIINWDVTSYYSYLPATFIYHDVTLEFIKNYPEKEFGERHCFFYQTAPNGSKVIKFTMGNAIMYAPFFFIAHATAHLLNYETNGFSIPYEFWLAISSLFYLIMGLSYLRKLLLLYFNEYASSATLIAVMLGTNLFYYSSSEPAMSHTYTFSLVSVFLYQFIRWYNNPSIKKIILIGLLYGLIVLIRPVNILFIVFPLIFDIYSGRTLINKVYFFQKHWKHLLLFLISAFIVFIPQLIYWKTLTGDWLFYSYLNESFYFLKPHIIDGFFSFRNGWLIYSPIMIFAVIGIFYLKRRSKEIFLPIVLFFVFNCYVMYCWWTWWYGGSFGSRPMIDSYALMSLPMAAIFQTILEKGKLIKIALVTIISGFVFINIFQSRQKDIGLIHHDAMTKDAYFLVFLKSDLNFNERVLLDKSLKSPNYDNALLGKDE